MKLYEQWENIAHQERDEKAHKEFWTTYFEAEKNNYEYILENKLDKLSGTVKELAEKFGMDSVTFSGFLGGIETSLTNTIDLANLTEESQIELSIDFKKLYFNMLDAKADWLYELPQWDDILSVEERKEITKEFKKSKTYVKEEPEIERNAPCPCGSGKKYKKCCMNK